MNKLKAHIEWKLKDGTMIPGANCTYFKPNNLGGMCNHSGMRRGFWIFSRQGNCILTHEKKIECELRMPIFKPVTKVIKTSKSKPKPKRKAPHIHKNHIHKREK